MAVVNSPINSKFKRPEGGNPRHPIRDIHPDSVPEPSSPTPSAGKTPEPSSKAPERADAMSMGDYHKSQFALLRKFARRMD
jgi:hypothetical protein